MNNATETRFDMVKYCYCIWKLVILLLLRLGTLTTLSWPKFEKIGID